MATSASLCKECESAAGFTCDGCRSTRYCSKACQQLSWPIHKHLCKTFKDFQNRPTSEKPTESYSRAILFRLEEKHPRFIWLKLILHDYGYLGPYLTPDEEGSNDALTLRKDEESSFERSFRRNDILNRELNYTIKLGSRDHGEEELEEYFSNDAQANENLLSILEKPVPPFVDHFSDPIIAYGTNKIFGQTQNAPRGVDLIPAHLRHIADYYNLASWGGYKPRQTKLSAGDKNFVTGVRINSDGDMHVNGYPRYEAVQLPASDQFFLKEATDVTKLIRLPMVIQRRSDGESMSKWFLRTDIPNNITPWKNTTATFLKIGCQPERADDLPAYVWGVAPGQWQESPDTVVVMRKDKKPLLIQHVAALSGFYHDRLKFNFEAQMKSGSSLGKDHVLKEITKEKFVKYFEKWKKEHSDPAARKCVSPYEI